MTKNRFKPRQLNVPSLWLENRSALLADAGVRHALEKLREQWEEIARFLYDEHLPWGEEYAREEYELDLHTGRVKVKDLNWLQETFEGIDLANLALAFAKVMHPEKEWLILEDDEIAVVTDVDRSAVVDFKNGSEISAECSLIIASDPDYTPSTEALQEVQEWYDARLAKTKQALEKTQELLRSSEEEPGEGKVVPLVQD